MAKMIPSDDVASVTHPFIGLRAFSYRDRRFFFGREQQLEVLVPLSSGSRFVTIVGSSGSGKSSLVRAGLLPRLESSEHGFIWIECRPREAPIRELAQAICSIGGTKGDYSEALTDRLELLLQKSSFGIREAMSFIELERSAKLLILVDQFEEIFRFADLRLREEVNAAFAAETRDEAAAFVRLLLTAAQISEYEIHIAITMRSDFIGDCARFHGLPEAVTASQFLVPSLTRDQRARAICKPIELAGATIEPALVQKALNDTNDDPDQLPVLQHAMMRCWEVASRRAQDPNQKPELSLSDYYAVGGVQTALSIHANEIVKQISHMGTGTDPRVVEVAVKRVFQALTEVDESGRTIRRPQNFSCLVQTIATSETAEASRQAEQIGRMIVSKFAEPRCSFLRAPLGADLNGNTIVDIGHEALIRCWDKLRGEGETDWVREEQEDAEKYRSLLRVAMVNSIIGEQQLPTFETWWLNRNPTRAWARRYTRGNVDRFSDVSALLRKSRNEVERLAREKEETQKTKADLAYARRLAFWIKCGSVALGALAVFAFTQLWYANRQIALKDEAEKLANFNFNRYRYGEAVQGARDIYDSLARPLNVYFELSRDVDRVDSSLAKNATKSSQTGARAEFERAQKRVTLAQREQQGWLNQLNLYSEHLWEAINKSNRTKIVANVERVLASTADSQSKLRLAMYAVAAIPESYTRLNTILRDAISGSRQINNLRPPGATQTWGVAFDPRNNHRAAVGDEGGITWLWDPLGSSQTSDQSLKLLALSAAGGLVNGLAFNKDGSLLAAAYRSNGVVVWRLSASAPIVVCQLRPTGKNSGAYGVAFHESVVAIAGGDGAVHLWDVSNEQCPDKGKAFRRRDVVFGVAISDDGKMLAAASGDGSVAVWNIDNPEATLLDEQFRNPMFAVAFSHDGKTLAATGQDGIGYFWEIQNNSDEIRIERRSTELSRNEPNRGTLGQISFSPDEKKVAATALAVGTAVAAVVADAHTLKQDILLQTHKPSLFGVAFSPDSKNLLLTSNSSGSASLWSVQDTEPIQTTDRSELLQIGFRRLAAMGLSADECKILASMEIPVFTKSLPSTEECSLPLLAFQKFTLDIQF